MDLLILMVLVVVALLTRAVSGNWLAPGPFFCLFWVVNIGVALAAGRSFPVSPAGLWILVSLLIAFAVGSLAFVGQPMPQSGQGSSSDVRTFSRTLERRLRWAVAGLSVTALLGLALETRTGFAQFSLSLSWLSLLALAAATSSARYAGTAESAGAATWLVYFMYAAAPLGGALTAGSVRARWRLLGVAPVTICLVEGTLHATRAGFVLGLVMWMAGFFAWKMFATRGRYALFHGRTVPLVALLALVLPTVYVVLQWLRGGAWKAFAVAPLMAHAAASALAHVSAFSQWAATRPESVPTLGAYTFAGPFDLLGLARRSSGLFVDPVYFVGGEASNIYTAFRSLVEDFTLGGAWVLCSLMGLVTSWWHRSVRAGASVWIMPLALFYAFTLFSPIASLFTWNSIVGAWVIACGVWVLLLKAFVGPAVPARQGGT